MSSKGQDAVLAADEARAFLDSIPIVKGVAEDCAATDRPDLVGLRDRALIGLMAYASKEATSAIIAGT
jgi:hypothetical protein